MIWLEIMVLADGSRVESAMPTHEEAAAGLPDAAFRVRHADGATRHFVSMSETLQHLRRRFDAEELSRAAAGHPPRNPVPRKSLPQQGVRR